MWFLLEVFKLSPDCLFKQNKTLGFFRNLYLVLSPLIIGGRSFLLYNSGEEILGGYLLGSISSTLVFAFVSSTTLRHNNLKTGLHPLWVKLRLQNNLADFVLEQSNARQRLML